MSGPALPGVTGRAYDGRSAPAPGPSAQAATMLSKRQVLDRSYLDVRSAIVEAAATLDRHDRGGGESDARLAELYAALRLLADSEGGPGGRVERVLNHFTDDEPAAS